MSRIRETISKQVRNYRKAKGFSQAQLAEAAHISEDSVWAIERKKSTATLETLEQISHALNVDLLDLLVSRKVSKSEIDQAIDDLRDFLKVRSVEDVHFVQDIIKRIFSKFEQS